MKKLANLMATRQSGMETAIILIAFVVVAYAFAFAVLSTGLFTSDKSKETIRRAYPRRGECWS